MSWKHLTARDRDILAEMVHRGEKQAAIAEALGVHQSTISRELNRNAGADGYYRAYGANCLAHVRRCQAMEQRPLKMQDRKRQQYVQERLMEHWSPEQISGRLKLQRPGSPESWVSHETIYAWIWEAKRQGQQWHLYLRQGHRKHHRRSRGQVDRRGKIPNRTWIDQRPATVEAKERFGHWESDTVLGRRSGGSVITHVERKSQYLVLAPMPVRHWRQLIEGTRQAFERHGQQLGRALPIKSTTVDNGQEFYGHELMRQELGMDVYFAHPHHPWERGLNEQVNGLIRQYLPKGCDMKKIDVEQVKLIEQSLNNRPRKTLGYRTPQEVLRRHRVYASRV